MRMSAAFPPAVLAVALALVPRSASAARLTTIGLKGGLSVSTLHGSLPTDAFVRNGWRLGAAGGVSLAIGLGDRLSIQPEVLYVAKGTSLGTVDLTDETGSQVGTADVTVAISYLEIPFLARVALSSWGPASVDLLAGPAVSMRLSQQFKVGSASTDLDFVKRTDVGFTVGTGLTLGRGPVRGSLETRYTLGLSPATDSSYSDSARNGDLLVMAGLAIHR